MVKKRRVSKKKIRKFMIFLILIVGIIIALVLFLNKPKEHDPIFIADRIFQRKNDEYLTGKMKIYAVCL